MRSMAVLLLQCSVVSMVILSTAESVNPLIEIKGDGRLGNCSQSVSLLWKFILRYFKGIQTVLLFRIKDSSNSTSLRILRCAFRAVRIPVIHFQLERYELAQSPTSSLNWPISVFGLVITTDSVIALEFHYKTIARIDHMIRLIVVLTNATTEEIDWVLRTAFDVYHMLNVVVLHSFRSFGKNYTFTKGKLSPYNISAYDPFSVAADGGRGHVYNHRIHEGDISGVVRIVRQLEGRITDLRGYPLNVCIYNKKDSVKPDIVENGTVVKYTFRDGEIIHALSEVLNFKPVYYSPPDGIKAGYIFDNGTMSGTLREIESGGANITGNLRMLNDYGQKTSTFLFPIYEEELNFILPKKPPRKAVSFLMVLRPEVTTVSMSCQIAVLVFWMSLRTVHRRWTKEPTNRTASFVEAAFAMFGTSVLTCQKQRTVWFERFLLTGWSFSTLITSIVYQGVMINYIMMSDVPQDIDTLQQLADSDLRIQSLPIFEDALVKIAASQDSPKYYKRLYERFELIVDENRAVREMARLKNAAVMQTKSMCQTYELDFTSISNETGAASLHVMKDGPPSRFASFMVPKDTPFKARFDEILIIIRESGLVSKWRDDLYHSIHMKKSLRMRNFEERKSPVYTIHELGFVFDMWLKACGICFLVFLAELFAPYLTRRFKNRLVEWALKNYMD